MAKKVIQVPVDQELLKKLDDLSGKQGKSRSELIRQACLQYLQNIEHKQLDDAYQLGYMKMPERPETSEAQIAVADKVTSGESP